MYVRAYTSGRVHDVAGRGPLALKPGRPVVQGGHNALQLNEGAPTQLGIRRRAASVRQRDGRHPVIPHKCVWTEGATAGGTRATSPPVSEESSFEAFAG